MGETIKTVVSVLNSLTPLGLAGGLGYVIFVLVKVRTNHLHNLPHTEANVDLLVGSLNRVETTLGEIRDGINYLKGRVH